MTNLNNDSRELDTDALDLAAGGVRFLGIDISLVRNAGSVFAGPLIGTAIGGAVGGKASENNEAA